MNGAQIFIESLVKEGVDVIFGFPGGAVLPVYDVLYDSKIKHVMVRHEQGAVHAADGYARATGKTGICLVTSGPGATNTVTGIATANMDSVPIIVFCGQVPTPMIGNDAFQEADIVGITRPCTKHNYLVKDVKDLALIIKEAFFIASKGKPGPVLIDLPKDVLMAEYKFEYPSKINIRGYNPNYKGHSKQIKKMADAIYAAKKPVIYSGGGVVSSNAAEDLTTLANTINIPLTTTLMGLGGFPSANKLSLGMCGMHGTFSANMAITEADLIIGVGVRFDDRVTGKLEGFAPKAKIIHIDIDPTSIGKNKKADIPIVGDVKDILSKLIKLLKNKKDINWKEKHKPWLNTVNNWKKTHPLKYIEDKEKIKPQYILQLINKITKSNAIITTEVGQNQMWAAQFCNFKKPRTFLTSGGLGTMGYGFPAAIGAQVAYPDKLVIGIAGDGSFQMNIQELATAVEYNLCVKIVLLNNSFLGMVRQWQELFHNKRYSSTCLKSGPDFVKVAEAYGAIGLRATKPEEVEDVLKKGFSIKKPVVMDFHISREENVYPMVPAGAPISEMLLV